jgi:hypothetical protein
MRTPFLLSILLSTSVLFAQQIPNAGFENWSMVGDVEEPDGWTTNNYPGFITVEKSTDSYSGEYAMYVINNGISFEGPLPGTASTNFTPTENANLLSFHVKVDSISGTGGVRILVFGIAEGVYDEIGSWQSSEIIPEYAYIEVETEPFMDYEEIRITIAAVGGNDETGTSTGHASFFVDEMSTSFSTGITSHTAEVHLDVQMNGRSVQVRDPEGNFERIKIIDMSGRELVERAISGSVSIDVSSFAAGVYLIRGIHGNGLISTRRSVFE